MPSSCTRVHDADGRALVGAEDALEVRVGRDDRLGDVGRLELVAAPYWMSTILMFGSFFFM